MWNRGLSRQDAEVSEAVAGEKERAKACLVGWKENGKDKNSVDRNLSGVERPCRKL